MQLSNAKVPAHLRRFVVEQDYGAYTAVDQAVWRFVLLQTHSRLVHTAHPAYKEGLDATGISVERIPSIAEMNEKLARFGWSAVCVDGFIPPRAFQEFQALGILPIAADIRRKDHLVYTPAPDIIHEAAGHAPILPDPAFASYLRRIGEVGKRAFTVPAEDRVFRAVYTLSEVKEDRGSTPADLRRVEAELAEALASVTETSEAARLSRLYWWTAEYGLVGRPDDYRLYGAGLLSSLWESHACHDPSVKKLPLDETCTEVGYDITRPQPQLFVARDFMALHEVLDRVSRTLGAELGGETALERAERSEELASVRFSSGLWVMGTLVGRDADRTRGAWLEFRGSVAVARDGVLALRDFGRPDEQLVFTGPLDTGELLEGLSEERLANRAERGRLEFRFESGARAEGRLTRSERARDGRLIAVELRDARVSAPGRAPLELERFVLIAAGRPLTAQAGAIDPNYHEHSEYSPVRVPKASELAAGERRLLALYERAGRAHERGGPKLVPEFRAVYSALTDSYPREWLLRWNLLESLLKAGHPGELARTLHGELEALELEFDHRQPIASGLRYLQIA